MECPIVRCALPKQVIAVTPSPSALPAGTAALLASHLTNPSQVTGGDTGLLIPGGDVWGGRVEEEGDGEGLPFRL